MVETISFFLIASGAVVTAVLMILQRNPVMSAIYLIANFFCLALLYLLLQAQLLAILQIVVYTGAIMVLVIFVIMLLNLGDEQRLTERVDFKKVVGMAIVLGFLAELMYLIGFRAAGSGPEPATQGLTGNLGTVEAMGTAMFGKFLLPFEVTSLLLLAAIVGAVVLARKQVSPPEQP